MPLSASSMAAAVGAAARNVKFTSGAQNVPRKIVVIGTYDPAKTEVDPEVLALSGGPGWAGATYGFGFMLHRLISALDVGAQGIEIQVVPQEETGEATQAAGELEFVGSDVTAAGTLHLYVAGIYCPVSLVVGDDDTTIPTKVETAINAIADLPITAADSTTAVVTTAKSAGPWGNDISLTFNQGFQQALPAGVVCTVTAMTGGTGIPDVADALAVLGTGDDANEKQFTDGLCGYGYDTDTLDAISTWNGVGNDPIGLYLPTVARPIRFLVGDVCGAFEGDQGAAALEDLITIGDARASDRTNGLVAAPGSPNHPMEIAAIALGTMARLNDNRAAESYVGKVLPGVFPGALTDRWTSEYDNRDAAVKAGISPTVVEGGAVLLQNVLTFYHPESVTPDSNGYRSMRNISIVQNLLENIRANFRTEKWQGISIVADVAKVTNVIDRQKARDLDAVMDDLVALATAFESKAWIFSAAFTIGRLQAGGCLAVRSGGLGFDIILPVLLSGEGSIYNIEVQFDTNLSVIL